MLKSILDSELSQNMSQLSENIITNISEAPPGRNLLLITYIKEFQAVKSRLLELELKPILESPGATSAPVDVGADIFSDVILLIDN